MLRESNLNSKYANDVQMSAPDYQTIEASDNSKQLLVSGISTENMMKRAIFS